MVEMMGFPRRFATLDPSFASSVGRNPKNVPLARFLNGIPPHRFDSLSLTERKTTKKDFLGRNMNWSG